MDVEAHEWYKRFLVIGGVPGLLRPDTLVLSEADSTRYHWEGRLRGVERNMAVFQYTLSGMGSFVLDGTSHPLPAGTGFCCHVADPRIAYCFPEGQTTPWRFLYISFCDPLGLVRAVNERVGYLFSPPSTTGRLRRLMEYGESSKVTIELQAGAAHHLVDGILSMLVDQAQERHVEMGPQVRLVRRALHLIENNLRRAYNAAMLAEELGVSQEHLTRVCRDELGQTPYQCICETKVHRACELLKNTSCTVAEIAVQLGYEPGSHFARLFKRVMEVTPSAFRQGVQRPLSQI
jgi:AraC-like DNA-binding protein